MQFRTLFTGIMALLIGIYGNAVYAADNALIADMEQNNGVKIKHSVHPVTGTVRMFRVDKDRSLDQPGGLPKDASHDTAAKNFLVKYGSLFGIQNPHEELLLKKERLDEKGNTFIKYQQTHKGLPIIAGELIVQTDTAKKIRSVHGRTSPIATLDILPVITADEAKNRAIALVKKQRKVTGATLTASEPVLSVYNPALMGHKKNMNSLVWQIEVTAGDLMPIREFVLVDAQRGSIALHFNQFKHAKYRKIYNNMNDAWLGIPGTLARIEGSAPKEIPEVDKAYNYAGDAYDFFYTHHNRDSINDKGMSIVATVNFCMDEIDCPMANAFWTGTQMAFGEGFVADDALGHEYVHGLTEYETDFYYYMQSGAISETFSDLWGEFIDQTNGKGSDAVGDKWLIGEDIPSGPLRSMKDPTVDYGKGGDPDKMSSANYVCGGMGNDNGGVHSNNGINNKAVYLMTDGDTFNGKTVTGIGVDKVSQIYYYTLTNLLTSGSEYDDLYNGLLLACDNLVGTAGISAADCVQVKNALDAVEMNTQPTNCAAPEAPYCPVGKTPINTFYDGFEVSAANWVATGTTGIWTRMQMYAANGSWVAAGSNKDWYPSDASYEMRYNQTIPANAYMRFSHAFEFEDETTAYDGGVLEYSIDNGVSWQDTKLLFVDNGYNAIVETTGFGNPLEGRDAFGNLSNGYMSSRLTLASLEGLNVRFRFRIGNDGGWDQSGWIIDDVQIYQCLDITSPVVTPDIAVIKINNDDATTSKTAATLTLNKAGATKMRFMMNTTTWTAWEAYNTTKAVTLPTGDGIKTVYVQFDNDLANVYYDTIILDMKVPVGTIVIEGGADATLDLTVDLTLTAADNSDITHMCISPTATCPDATLTYNWEPFNTAKTFTIPGAASAYGTKTVYAKFKDKAGKISTAVSDTIMYAAPMGGALIPGFIRIDVGANLGATYTTTTAVTLTITDPGANNQIKFSNNGTTWTVWETVKTSKAYTLPAGDGIKTVYVKFRPIGGADPTDMYVDTIILDTKPPVGTIMINNDAFTTNSRYVTLQLEATDINGISTMQFSTDGIKWSAPEPYATTRNITLPAGDGTKKVSVKFKDSAGNISAIIYDSIILDTTAPVGKVTINAGAATTASDYVTLTLAAPTAVFMMISVDGGVTWGDWEPFVLSKKVTLPAGAGLKTVCVLFSDYTGNVSNAVDTITLTGPPTNNDDGTISIKGVGTGGAYTTSTIVTVDISYGAYDYMQFSTNGTTWTAWEATKTPKAITLPTGDGIKYVLAKFKTGINGTPTDAYGDTIILDTTAPTGAIVINANAASTNDVNVTVSINATDLNGVADMNFSLDGINWLGWEGGYATTKSLALTGADGTKKVSVKFKDNADKESLVIYDTILLDRVAPVGKVVINGGAATTTSTLVTLTLSAPTATTMQISLDGGSSWGSWEPFVTSKKVMLTGGVGENIVQMKFRDLTGNESIVAEDRITYQP